MQKNQNGQFTLNPQEYYPGGESRKQIRHIGKIISKSLSKSGEQFINQLNSGIPLQKQQQMKLSYPVDRSKSANRNYLIQEQPLYNKHHIKRTHQKFVNSSPNSRSNQNNRGLSNFHQIQSRRNQLISQSTQCFYNQQLMPVQSSSFKTSFRISRLQKNNSFIKHNKGIGTISNKSLVKICLNQSQQLIEEQNNVKTNRQKSPGFITQRDKMQFNSCVNNFQSRLSEKVQNQLNKKQKQLKKLLQKNKYKSVKMKGNKKFELPSVYKINNNIEKFQQFVQKTNHNTPSNKNVKKYYVFSQAPIIIQTDRKRNAQYNQQCYKNLQYKQFYQNQEQPLRKANIDKNSRILDLNCNIEKEQRHYNQQINQQNIVTNKLERTSSKKRSSDKQKNIQIYDKDTNKHRKPIHIDQFMDLYSSQKLFNSQQQTSRRSFTLYFKYFQLLHKNYEASIQENESISLLSHISVFKTLLIELEEQANIKIMVPVILLEKYLNNDFMLSLRQTSTSELHNVYQALLKEIQNSSKIIKVKKYKNCIYVSSKKKQAKKINNGTQVFALIWHFSGNVYIGDWTSLDAQALDIKQLQRQEQKQDGNGNINSNKQIIGYRNGVGLQICLIQQKVGLQNGQISYQSCIQMYIGQFKSSQKHGYGIKNYFRTNTLDNRIQSKIQIGCWQNNLRHGWMKTYLNNKLSQNAQYSSDTLIKHKTQKK